VTEQIKETLRVVAVIKMVDNANVNDLAPADCVRGEPRIKNTKAGVEKYYKELYKEKETKYGMFSFLGKMFWSVYDSLFRPSSTVDASINDKVANKMIEDSGKLITANASVEKKDVPEAGELTILEGQKSVRVMDEDHSTEKMKKIRLEVECLVCHEIPTSRPVPCCPSGHILCKECKSRIKKVKQREYSFKPCPLCRAPLGKNANNLAGNIISLFEDLHCSNDGCSFQGNMEDLNNHISFCHFTKIGCFICKEDFMWKNFANHNDECFLKNDKNVFNFPTEDSFFLIQGNSKDQDIIVDILCDYNSSDDEDNFDEDDNFESNNNVGLTAYTTANLDQNSKISIIVKKKDDPDYEMKVTTKITKKIGFGDKLSDYDVVLPGVKGGGKISFELL